MVVVREQRPLSGAVARSKEYKRVTEREQSVTSPWSQTRPRLIYRVTGVYTCCEFRKFLLKNHLKIQSRRTSKVCSLHTPLLLKPDC